MITKLFLLPPLFAAVYTPVTILGVNIARDIYNNTWNNTSQMWQDTKSVGNDLLQAVKIVCIETASAVPMLSSALANTVYPGIKTVIADAANTAEGVWGGVGHLYYGTKPAVVEVYSGIKASASDLYSGVTTVASDVYSGATTVVSDVYSGVTTVASDVLHAFKIMDSAVPRQTAAPAPAKPAPAAPTPVKQTTAPAPVEQKTAPAPAKPAPAAPTPVKQTTAPAPVEQKTAPAPAKPAPAAPTPVKQTTAPTPVEQKTAPAPAAPTIENKISKINDLMTKIINSSEEFSKAYSLSKNLIAVNFDARLNDVVKKYADHIEIMYGNSFLSPSVNQLINLTLEDIINLKAGDRKLIYHAQSYTKAAMDKGYTLDDLTRANTPEIQSFLADYKAGGAEHKKINQDSMKMLIATPKEIENIGKLFADLHKSPEVTEAIADLYFNYRLPDVAIALNDYCAGATHHDEAICGNVMEAEFFHDAFYPVQIV